MNNFEKDFEARRVQGYMLRETPIFMVYHVDGVPIENLNLSARGYNALKRAQIHTIGEIVDRSGELYKIRNMGIKSVREIKNAVLNYSYDNMTDKQKEEFWKGVLTR